MISKIDDFIKQDFRKPCLKSLYVTEAENVDNVYTFAHNNRGRSVSPCLTPIV